jgi:predicted O-methyltransferase YrrM
MKHAKDLLMRLAILPIRFQGPLRYSWKTLSAGLRWLAVSREHTNLTYDLTELNEKYLCAFVADVSRRPIEEIRGYLDELKPDEALRRHIIEATRGSDRSYKADDTARYGKRAGWYAFVRALKPGCVVETGVDKGLGSCVIAAALLRNRDDGFPGKYYGTDINPAAGYLLSGQYSEVGEILYGDSITSLRNMEERIDLFINDSDHSARYEEQEYQTVATKLSANALVIGDNAHVTDKLFKFARATDRQFAFFQEQPHRHWYPGGGIGVAYGP